MGRIGGCQQCIGAVGHDIGSRRGRCPVEAQGIEPGGARRACIRSGHDVRDRRGRCIGRARDHVRGYQPGRLCHRVLRGCRNGPGRGLVLAASKQSGEGESDEPNGNDRQHDSAPRSGPQPLRALECSSEGSCRSRFLIRGRKRQGHQRGGRFVVPLADRYRNQLVLVAGILQSLPCLEHGPGAAEAVFGLEAGGPPQQGDLSVGQATSVRCIERAVVWIELAGQDRILAVADVHAAPGHQLVGHDSDGIHVGGRADPLSHELLGGHVGRCPAQDAGMGPCCGELGQPEVDYPNVPRVAHDGLEQDVFRLHVAMDDGYRMSCLQTIQHLGHELVDDGPGDGSALRRGLSHLVTQRPPVDELHDQIRAAVELAEADQADDVGMVEAGQCLRFSPELRHLCVAARLVLDGIVQHLECAFQLDGELEGQVDGAEPALADAAHNQVFVGFAPDERVCRGVAGVVLCRHEVVASASANGLRTGRCRWPRRLTARADSRCDVHRFPRHAIWSPQTHPSCSPVLPTRPRRPRESC